MGLLDYIMANPLLEFIGSLPHPPHNYQSNKKPHWHVHFLI